MTAQREDWWNNLRSVTWFVEYTPDEDWVRDETGNRSFVVHVRKEFYTREEAIAFAGTKQHARVVEEDRIHRGR